MSSRTRFVASAACALAAWLSIPAAVEAATITVTQINTTFSPKDITINVGDTVKWVWTSTFHTTTEDNTAWDLPLDSGHTTQSVTFSAAFLLANSRPGNLYPYHCTFHVGFGQVGSIKVNTWKDLGFAKAGTSGLPALLGTGALQTGQAGSLNLTNARPSSLAILFLSAGPNTPVPLLGGTLAAFPIVSSLSLATGPTGSLPLPFVYPGGAPAGLNLTFQYAIQDPVATNGVALSNAVQTFAQ